MRAAWNLLFYRASVLQEHADDFYFKVFHLEIFLNKNNVTENTTTFPDIWILTFY